jgi:hypothetical protein
MQCAKIDFDQHWHDHQPDQQRDGDIDFSHGHVAEHLERCRQQPTEDDAG